MNSTERPDWYDRLGMGPAKRLSPSPLQVRSMIARSKNPAGRRRRVWYALGGVAVGLLIVLAGTNYAWEQVRQRDISQAAVAGSSERMDLQRAIEKFRDLPEGQMQIQDVEPWKDGVLVFYQRYFKELEYDMSVDYMRLTWRGWTWIDGGGMGGSYSEKLDPLHDSLHYEYLRNADEYLHTKTPFPMLYGALTGAAKSVRIERSDGFAVNATVFPSVNQLGWFAFLPNDDQGPYRLTAYDADGTLIASGELDPNEYKPPYNQTGALAEKPS